MKHEYKINRAIKKVVADADNRNLDRGRLANAIILYLDDHYSLNVANHSQPHDYLCEQLDKMHFAGEFVA